MTIVTRFAPSPTGLLHIGGVRTALFSWLFARRHGGRFILRVEDTDRERSTQEAVQVILDGMQWLGLSHDEGPYYQTRRFERYAEVLQQLLAQGKAYHCYCSKDDLEEMRTAQLARKQKPRYDGRCRGRSSPVAGVAPVIRFKNPLDGDVIVEDLVHGPVVFRNDELDDLIIARSDGTPTYNFCVVVDDSDMHITHVIRGDDHLNNTPRQINMLRAMGFTPPAYAHVAMILGADGAKLSKRHGAVSVLHYREEGYLPEALLNYLVRLGWSHGDQEIFTLEELTRLFDITEVNKAASAFNPEKLLWVNQQHMMRAPLPYLAGVLREQLLRLGIETDDQPLLEGIVAGQRERAKTLKEMAETSRYFFGAEVEIDDKSGRKHLTGAGLAMLGRLRSALEALTDWSAAGVHGALTAIATESGVGLGKVAQPLRVALTGTAVSPPIDATAALIGRERVLRRLDAALVWAQTAGV
ncbi:MAG TPA: glutamate--tRNA ligase [Steroidobacteraceae bacterium]|nr:glutamate--tRNA ligase [Steroidobacteraceae bacterium]